MKLACILIICSLIAGLSAVVLSGHEVEDDSVCKNAAWHNGVSSLGERIACKTLYQLNCPLRLNPQDEECHRTRDPDPKNGGCITCCCCDPRKKCHEDCPNHCETDEEGCPIPGRDKCTKGPKFACARKKEWCPRNCDSGGQGGYQLDNHGCVTCRCINDP